jgi:hypothetical protein
LGGIRIQKLNIIFPLSAPGKRLRYGRHINTLNQRIMTAYLLPIEIEHALPNSPLVDYRKESSEKGLGITPIKSEE